MIGMVQHGPFAGGCDEGWGSCDRMLLALPRDLFSLQTHYTAMINSPGFVKAVNTIILLFKTKVESTRLKF